MWKTRNSACKTNSESKRHQQATGMMEVETDTPYMCESVSNKCNWNKWKCSGLWWFSTSVKKSQKKKSEKNTKYTRTADLAIVLDKHKINNNDKKCNSATHHAKHSNSKSIYPSSIRATSFSLTDRYWSQSCPISRNPDDFLRRDVSSKLWTVCWKFGRHIGSNFMCFYWFKTCAIPSLTQRWKKQLQSVVEVAIECLECWAKRKSTQ